MINEKTGQRELAYVVRIDEIQPIAGYDRVEYARVNGWWVVVRKDQFKVGDPAVYFEVDSQVPAKEPFLFLEPRHFKIKTQKMCKVISQGLLMSFEDFGWTIDNHTIGDYVTEELNVTYAEAEDNKRKAKPADKYSKMVSRHPKIFKKRWAKFLMKRNWGKKLLFLFFGKKKDKDTAFPTHFPFVKKTDQERVENMPWVLADKTPFIKTQKCDGSSGTYILERKKHNKFEFYVCSRNVRQLDENQQSYYDQNYYWEVAKKYKIEEFLKDFLLNHPDIEYVCLQGEICAPGIQKNPQGLTETRFFAFHFTDSKKGRWNILEAKALWDVYGIPSVPIVDTNYILPDSMEEFKLDADGFYDASACEGKTNRPREGFVYYKTTDPNFSFKNVSRKYLLKNDK